MATKNIICLFLHSVVVRPVPISPTSAPRMTVYKIPDVLQQPPKIQTDTFRKTSSVSSVQTIPGIDPNRSKSTTWRRIPGISQNPVFSTAETIKSITAITPIVFQTKVDKGSELNPSTTNTDTLKNISETTPDQVQPGSPKISNTIAKTPTVTQLLGNGKKTPGKSSVSNKSSLPNVFFNTET